MKKIYQVKQFKKDLKRILKQGYDVGLLEHVVVSLAKGESLPSKYKVHHLLGSWNGFLECHIKPDWLLIYKIFDDYIMLYRTGSHSNLFD